MPLTVNSLHQPLADFFVERFGKSGSDEVVFRFDAFGSMLGEDDFVHPDDPEGAATAAIALEKVSDLANRVPRDSGDGANVVLTGDSIDSFYHDRMLAPAQVYVPPDTDAGTRKVLREQFEAIKADALRAWEGSELTSVTGSPLPFRPTRASPTTWYDSGADGWSGNSFTVKEPSRASSRPRAAVPVMWKAMPTETVLAQSLERAKVSNASLGDGAVTVSGTTSRAAGSRPRKVRVRDHRSRARGSSRVRDHRSDSDRRVSTLRLRDLDAVRRIRVRAAVAQSVRTEHATTDQVKISFEYCLVSLHRRWWSGTFVAGGWRVPGQSRGGLTEPGAAGYMDLLPVGFVAVRGLTITARWSDQDRKQLQNAMAFGPFTVAGSAGTGEVTEPGLQVIGWILQRLPALPPHAWTNRPDGSGRTATTGSDGTTRKYTVRRGDTLFGIAERFYGDGSMYPAIAEANEIENPSRIGVGQSLVIPPR